MMGELKSCNLLQTVKNNLGYILRDINECDKVFLYVKTAQFALSQYEKGWHTITENETLEQLIQYRKAYEQLAEYAAKSLLNVKEGGTTLSHNLKAELMARFLEAKENG